MQTRLQFAWIIWFYQVIIRSRSQSSDFALDRKLRCGGENNVQWLGCKVRSSHSAKLIPMHTRNLPICEQYNRLVVALQVFPGVVPVIDGNGLIIPFSDQFSQQAKRKRIILSDENFHAP